MMDGSRERDKKGAASARICLAQRKMRTGARHSCRFSVKRRAALKKLERLAKIDVEAA
jgi:hypothetical protein